jgi:hypothetical protein
MTSTALVPVGDLEKMAAAVAASKLFGITTPEQALALMLVAQAEGLHPATAARDYHIIQGRPTLKADAMLARYLASGGKVEWGVHTDTEVEATFSHPQGGTLKIKWDMARAKAAELGGKGMWLKYPRQMLRARVISEGVRATNPAVSIGIYTPEEAEDFEPAKRGAKAKDMGKAEIVDEGDSALRALEAAGVSTRESELDALCKQAGISPKFYLNRAGVNTASKLSDEDWTACVDAVKRKIKAAQDKAELARVPQI